MHSLFVSLTYHFDLVMLHIRNPYLVMTIIHQLEKYEADMNFSVLSKACTCHYACTILLIYNVDDEFGTGLTRLFMPILIIMNS